MSNRHLWPNLAKGELTLQLNYAKKKKKKKLLLQLQHANLPAFPHLNSWLFKPRSPQSISLISNNQSVSIVVSTSNTYSKSPHRFIFITILPFHCLSLTWTTPLVIYAGLVTPLLKILCFLSHIESNPNFLPWQQGPTQSYNLTLPLLLTSSPTTYSYHLFSLFSRHTGLFSFLSL